MSLALGTRLKIRSMIHLAAEPLPFFWPMRTFIHHNPLHGLEHLRFEDAVKQGAKLFHARAALPREQHQRYLADNKIDLDTLKAAIDTFADQHTAPASIDLRAWLEELLIRQTQKVCLPAQLADASTIHSALHGESITSSENELDTIAARLHHALLEDRPIYESVDAIYGSEIGEEINELVIKSCLDFFDEGQSVWEMPEREEGFFTAWRDIARRNVRFFIRGLHINQILEVDNTPEGIIAYVLEQLEVPTEHWIDYFTRELSQMHGWAGFIRWRASAKHYYWGQRYPADLVDFMAVRLSLGLAILNERRQDRIEHTTSAISSAIKTQPQELYLRHELNSGSILPAMAHQVERVLAVGKPKQIQQTFADYVARKRADESQRQARRLRALATAVGAENALQNLSVSELDTLINTFAEFERGEDMLWLNAMEHHAMAKLIRQINPRAEKPREKRPFAQALFCIDTRSERIRRHLESVGDYQTFGIAGFFGVPVSFMELGNGNEIHLCPVLLTPKNLVTEIATAHNYSDAALSALGKVMHELKESVLTPFVTVEAIGLLFGFDMIGKTMAPQTYTRLRKHLSPTKPATRMLLDKLDREQADSIIRAVQRAMIETAIEQDFQLETGSITDNMVRELREFALGHASGRTQLAEKLDLDEKQERDFIRRLRHEYRINRPFAQLQLERLGRIGFSRDEQAMFVGQALRAIGLTKDFSRFVLLVGHGSTSENNPFESALDCGACGGNHGLVSARVLAQMANKPEVRRRLQRQGVNVPDDTCFIAALHNTTTDEIRLSNLELLPPPLLVYLDRLRSGLSAASQLCAQERVPTLEYSDSRMDATSAYRIAQRNAMDWSQVRPEWGLSGNAYFIIGQRQLTRDFALDGRAFLHSYDYRLDPKQRLLETILTGPLVVGQWINMEHYFSTVDNERFGSGSKVYHNVAGRFGVMTGNLSDLRTGLPSQTVLKDGLPYHQPMRLMTLIEAPLEHAERAINSVSAVKNLVTNSWLRLMVFDPETGIVHTFQNGQWLNQTLNQSTNPALSKESTVS